MAQGAAPNAMSQPMYLTDSTGADQGGIANPQRTTTQGASTIVTNQVTVGTTATLIVAARAGRARVSVTSTAATAFYVGASGVTIATGEFIAATAGASKTLDTSAAVYAVVATGTLVVSYVELY